MYKQEPPPQCFQTRASETHYIRWVSPLAHPFQTERSPTAFYPAIMLLHVFRVFCLLVGLNTYQVVTTEPWHILNH